MLERERFNRTLTGIDWHDQRKFRQRLDSLNEAHAVVAPYAHHIRIVLHTEADIRKFAELCTVADLKRPFWTNVEAFNKGFFSPKQLHLFEIWLQQFSWPVAFQLEALLRGGLMHTEDLMVHFRSHIEKYGVHVELNTELVSFSQDADGVTAHVVKRSDGSEVTETIRTPFMIGADGARGIFPAPGLTQHKTQIPCRYYKEGTWTHFRRRVTSHRSPYHW